MNYRNLGNSGLKVSVLCCGTHDFRDLEIAKDLIHRSFEKGINFIDTACSYGEKGEVEILTGQAIEDLPRDEIVVATKVRWGYGAQGANNRGLSRKHIRHSAEISLKRLNLDFIDLYQLHGPVNDCPMEETVRSIDGLIKQGKILYWGISNFNSAQTLMLLNACDTLGVERPISHQPKYNLVEPGLVDTHGRYIGLDQLSERYGFGIIPYSPLEGGVLTGKYLDGIPDDSRMKGKIWGGWKKTALSDKNMGFVRDLKVIADSLETPLSQLSLAWVLSRPFVSSAITAYTKVSQLEDNVQSVDVELSAETLEKIDALRKEYGIR